MNVVLFETFRYHTECLYDDSNWNKKSNYETSKAKKKEKEFFFEIEITLHQNCKKCLVNITNRVKFRENETST